MDGMYGVKIVNWCLVFDT